MGSPLQRFLSRLRRRQEAYRCKRCGCVFSRKGAKVSGWSNHPYGFHVHCPRCGATVSQFVKKQPDGKRKIKLKSAASCGAAFF